MGIENIVFTKVFLIKWIIKLTIEGEGQQTRELKEY